MTFLSKLGQVMQIAGKVVAVVTGFGPVITALTPTKKDDEFLARIASPLQQIAGIVAQVEGMAQALDTPLPGAEKLKMATPIVAQIILSDLIAGKKISNPVLFKQGCASITSGVADVLNSIKEDEVKTTTISD